MSAIAEPLELQPGAYHGLRLTADEYFGLSDDGAKYELIDGVVVRSPSPSTRHQWVAGEVFKQLVNHVDSRRLGVVLFETDVHLRRPARGRDLVYRPEMVFIRADRVAEIGERLRIVPDLVVEIISPESRGLDSKTKHGDYERAGVGEYWLIDPEREAMTFHQLVEGRFTVLPPSGDSFESRIIPGLILDLTKVRAAFQAFAP